ncbi:MAG: hypothetical protein WD059_13760 [Balneolaceae bacterium]
MTSNVVSTKLQNTTITHPMFAIPLLNRIKKESREEYDNMQQAFDLLGWGDLPDDLKIEIYEDVKFMVQELKGYYSSCNPFVQRRRESIDYWVSCFKDGICTIDAAIKALKVKTL